MKLWQQSGGTSLGDLMVPFRRRRRRRRRQLPPAGARCCSLVSSLHSWRPSRRSGRLLKNVPQRKTKAVLLSPLRSAGCLPACLHVRRRLPSYPARVVGSACGQPEGPVPTDASNAASAVHRSSCGRAAAISQLLPTRRRAGSHVRSPRLWIHTAYAGCIHRTLPALKRGPPALTK